MPERVADPYPRSWVDRIFDRIERGRLPVWIPYAALLVVTVVLGVFFRPPRYPEIPGWLITSLTPIMLASTHWLRTVTAAAAERARSALTLSDAEFAILAYRLTYAPPRTSWAFVAFVVAYLPAYVASSLEPFGYRELPLPVLIPGVIGWMFGEAVVGVFLTVSLRRLYFISRLSRTLGRVELFRPQPLHALSAVTTKTAVVTVLAWGYVPLLSLGSEAFADPAYLGSLVVGAILAMLLAVVPLAGTHRVVAEERRTRAMANGRRIEEAVAALATAVERNHGGDIEAHQRTLGALLTERDLIARAHTWPWPPGTVRNLATTVLLPVFLLLTGRAVDRWLSG